MTLDCLPRVDSCCGISLDTAVIIIGIWSIFWPIEILVNAMFNPLCTGVDYSGYGWIERGVAIAIAVTMLVLIIGSIILLYLRCQDDGTTDVYVIAAFAAAFLLLCHIVAWIVLILTMLDKECVNPIGQEFIPIGIVVVILKVIMLIYFAIVVNSFGWEHEWEEDPYFKNNVIAAAT